MTESSKFVCFKGHTIECKFQKRTVDPVSGNNISHYKGCNSDEKTIYRIFIKYEPRIKRYDITIIADNGVSVKNKNVVSISKLETIIVRLEDELS